MLHALRRLFDSLGPGRVADSADAPPQPAATVQIAAAALLLELAHADGEFSETEQTHIQGALLRHFGLDQAGADNLLTVAEAERKQSVDHFKFTRRIVQEYDLGQRMVLAEIMWRVILADGELADHEAYLVRKLGNLLELEPAYLSSARRKATEAST